MTAFTNIALGLKKNVSRQPYKRAVVCPAGVDACGRIKYTQITFLQLDQESDKLAHGLEKIGITRGTRTVLMVTPGIDFFIIIFAMFKVGAVPVVVDPGMGISRMVHCFSQGRPTAFIGIEKAHVLRKLKPRFFKTVKQWVTVGKRWFWGGYTLKELMSQTSEPYTLARTSSDEMAAIVFTSGSTGPAKGVVYSHGNFVAQLAQIQKHFQIAPDEIDLPTFPLFALFDPILGMTAVIPDMDPTKPAFVDPTKIIEAVKNHGITNMFASPALLNRVGKYGKENGVKLESLRRVVSAGAPVSPSNIEQFSCMLSDQAQIHTPYGASEAVPILSISSNEILAETRSLTEKGYGMCVGRPICDTRIHIIKITDEPITQFHERLLINESEVGEIVVNDPLVTRQYYNNRKADLLAKIPDSNGNIWHRMGDLGWRDKKGRIWFCGRKSHRVISGSGSQTLFTEPVEAIFNNHEKVFRSALAGAGKAPNQIPVIFVEPYEKVKNKKKFLQELQDLARTSPLTEGIQHFFIEKRFPVDIRHNSKIFREQLSEKATAKLK